MRMISSRTAAKSRPPLLLNAPGTFSQTIYRGLTMSPVRPFALSCSLISFTMRTCSMNNPLLAPANPARFPAILKSWHGDPPVITSTTSISAPLIFVISPRCFISIPHSDVIQNQTIFCHAFLLVGLSLVHCLRSSRAAALLGFARRTTVGRALTRGRTCVRPASISASSFSSTSRT